MRTNACNVFKGLVIGVAAGAVIGFIITPKSRDVKHAASKFLNALGSAADAVNAILRR